jgi:hypothetical protein
MTCKQFSQRPSQFLGIEDDAIAAAFDLAAGHCLFRFDSALEATRLEALTAGVATSVLNPLVGGAPQSLATGTAPRPSSDSFAKSKRRVDDQTPIYINGEYVCGNERIKMTKEEFIERTKVPSASPSGDEGGVWWETSGTPRVFD